MQRYRIGLDVGTASLGVAALSLDEHNQPTDLIWHTVRIFDEPLENSQAGRKSKKAARRQARMQRRQIDRRAGRVRRIAQLAPLLGITLTPPPDSGRKLPELRARAAREKIDLSDLVRVFIRLAKRRGYAGEFRAKKGTAKLGEVEGGSQDLQDQMAALAAEKGQPLVTLGEFLHHRWVSGLPVRLKVKEEGSKDSTGLPNLYALRKQVEAEFEHIWLTQAAHHPVLQTTHQGRSLREIFHEAIFYQRPLKAITAMVGSCSLEPTLPRAPCAQMAFQRFRIEKTLADLRWGAGRGAEPLTPEQKNVIRELLDENETVTFTVIYNALAKAGHPKPEGRGLNFDRISREELKGNKTLHVFRTLGLDSAWQSLDSKTQIRVINFLADLGSPEQLDDLLWHTRFVKQDGIPRFQTPRDADFIGFINQIRTHDKFDRLSKMGFDGGRASYSVKALNQLSGWLVQPWWPEDWADALRIDEEAAVRVCYGEKLSKSVPKHITSHLKAPKPTGNAVVDGSLRQIRYVLNRMMQDLGGPPQEIVVEMARDMGVGITRRNEREKENKKNQNARKRAEDEIRTHGARVTRSRVLRYLLWCEQDKQCPYCSAPIGMANAMNGAAAEYEHILPRSLSQVGYKRSEIVLAHRHCNQEKGNRTPWEAWGDGRDPERWGIIEQRARALDSKHRKKGGEGKNKGEQQKARKARLLLLKDFEKEVLTDESIAGFADRQFHQTSWIAKEAALWLQDICPTPVSVSRGQVTAFLRRRWKLDTVIPEARLTEGLPVLDEEGKPITAEEFRRYRRLWEGHRASSSAGFTERRPDKRLDHRHHLIDAITIALTSRALYQKMARQYKLESEQPRNSEHPRFRAVAPPLLNVRKLALRAVQTCRPSFKPNRFPAGALFQDMAYGVVSAETARPKLVRRFQLTSLATRTATEAQVRKEIASIVSENIRKIVLDAFEARIAEGKSPAAALAEPIYQTLYSKKTGEKKSLPVLKVKCYTGLYADGAIQVTHTSKDGRVHRKNLLLPKDRYCYLETEWHEDRMVRQTLVNIQQALAQRSEKPDESVRRLYKGDAVVDAKDNQSFRVGYFTAEGQIHLVSIMDPRSYDSIKQAGLSKRKVPFRQIKRLSRID